MFLPSKIFALTAIQKYVLCVQEESLVMREVPKISLLYETYSK